MVYKIKVSLSCFAPTFTMEIDVPADRDSEEHIDELYAKGRNTCMGDEEMDEILHHLNPKLHKKLIDAATGEDY